MSYYNKRVVRVIVIILLIVEVPTGRYKRHLRDLEGRVIGVRFCLYSNYKVCLGEIGEEIGINIEGFK